MSLKGMGVVGSMGGDPFEGNVGNGLKIFFELISDTGEQRINSTSVTLRDHPFSVS